VDYKIVTDEKALKIPCNPVSSLEEGERIAYLLFDILQTTKNAAGLAANQIGINKRVCVVNVAEPLYFINPVITAASGHIYFNEGCLSYPNVDVLTSRYRIIGVRADNFKGDMKFFTSKKNILECVCVQHEIDHLYGITMFERKRKQ
jgi:peptide deformylase